MHPVLILVVLVTATTGVRAKHTKTCPPPFGKYPFHADRFQGVWYAVAKHVSLPGVSRDMDPACVKINYTVTRTDNATRLDIVADIKEKSGQTKKIEMKGKELWSGKGFDSAVSQAVWRRDGSTHWGDVGQHSVLTTDYETYAIVQVCSIFYSESEDDFKRFQVTQILSRKPIMDASKLSLLKTVAATSDVDETEFKDIDNSTC